jgi:hypothetical protein
LEKISYQVISLICPDKTFSRVAELINAKKIIEKNLNFEDPKSKTKQ